MAEGREDFRSVVPGLANAACPLPEVVTGGQPAEAHLEELARRGYRTVLDLRAPEEPRPFDEPAAARRLGLEYLNLPVTPETLTDETFSRFRDLMRDRGRRPVIVHCGSGNRVGAVLIPYLVLDEGKGMEEAMETALEVGLRSQELADRALDYVRRHLG